MSDFMQFMKVNKVQKENATYAATKYLKDEDGNPLKWEIKPVTTRENNAIRNGCTKELQVTGKPGMYREKLDTDKYLAKLICESVTYPDLNNADLQDSYGVMDAESLITEMIDDPGEYGEFAVFIQEYNGFIPLQEKVDEAKN